jgi:hypothetical protein
MSKNKKFHSIDEVVLTITKVRIFGAALMLTQNRKSMHFVDKNTFRHRGIPHRITRTL